MKLKRSEVQKREAHCSCTKESVGTIVVVTEGISCPVALTISYCLLSCDPNCVLPSCMVSPSFVSDRFHGLLKQDRVSVNPH